MSRISYVKLINHVVLGNVEFNIDNDMISILGKNGSGKSFLIDTLQPFSRSNRFVGSYPVVPNATGYKQVNFKMPDGNIYETIHEYVPKGKTHACKSYLNKITNGIRLELNPTGHCEKFEELVKQHLNFDNSCLTVGFLSYKANGITSSRGVERKKILETTIDNPILKAFKKNAKNLATEYNAMAKQYEKQKIRIASQYTEESLNEDIGNLEHQIDTKRAILDNSRISLGFEENRLKSLLDISNVDVEKLRNIYQIYKSISDDRTIYDYYSEYQNAVRASERLSNEFLDLSERLKRYNRKNALEGQIKSSQSLLDDVSGTYDKNMSKLGKIINPDKRKDILPWLNSLISLAKHFSDILNENKLIIVSANNIDNILNQLVEKKKDNEEFIIRYTAALANIDGNKYDVNFQDNCNSCQLYDKFIKSDKFVTDMQQKWIEVMEVEQPEIETKIRDLNLIRSNIRISLQNSLESIPTYIVSPDKTGLTTLDGFLEGCSKNILYAKLVKLYDWVKETNNIIDVSKEKIDEIRRNIEEYEIELRGISILEDVVPDILNTEIQACQDKLSELDKIITNTIGKTVGALDITDSDIFGYIRMKKDEVISLYSKVDKVDSDIKHCKIQIEKLKEETTIYPKQIESMIIKQTEIKAKLNDLKNLNKNLVEYDNKRKVFLRCRELLDKDIPIALLRNNLQFIEQTTNSILSNNNIPMSVNIVPSESEVTIEVNVKDKFINDAVQLSAGETAIISLLLNSCILHIIGYPILCLDECDGALDIVNREKYVDLITSLHSVLRIDQMFIISHNIAAMNISYATKLLVGSDEGLDITDTTNLIKI